MKVKKATTTFTFREIRTPDDVKRLCALLWLQLRRIGVVRCRRRLLLCLLLLIVLILYRETLRRTFHDYDLLLHLKEKPMPTLVVLIGGVRGGEKAWKTLYKHVLDVNGADLALVVGEAKEYHNSSLYKRAKYVWEFSEFEDWSVAMDQMGPSLDPPYTWRHIHANTSGPDKKYSESTIFGPIGGTQGSGAINYYARWVLMEKIKDYNLLDKYQRFMVTRTDHFYLCDHDFTELRNSYIWLPRGSDFLGLCDRHIVCSNQHIMKVLNILPPLVRTPKKYLFQKPWRLPTWINPESLTLRRWKEEGIDHLVRRFERMMFLVAEPTDITRWSTPKHEIASGEGKGLGVKYFCETKKAKEVCQSPLVIKRSNVTFLYHSDVSRRKEEKTPEELESECDDVLHA